MSKDAFRKLGNKVKALEEELYTIKMTGDIKPLTKNEMYSKSFKDFICNKTDLRKIATKKILDENTVLKNRQKKIDKIIRRNNLDESKKNLHLTGYGYVRIATFLNVQELLNDINDAFNKGRKFYMLPNGYKVRPASLRYRTFVNNLTCVSCGLTGSMLCLEKCLDSKIGNEGRREGEGYHLNLYALTSEGKEVLMTKDHILPKSLGGPDTIENMQTMCTCCNMKKGNTYVEDKATEDRILIEER